MLHFLCNTHCGTTHNRRIRSMALFLFRLGGQCAALMRHQASTLSASLQHAAEASTNNTTSALGAVLAQQHAAASSWNAAAAHYNSCCCSCCCGSSSPPQGARTFSSSTASTSSTGTDTGGSSGSSSGSVSATTQQQHQQQSNSTDAAPAAAVTQQQQRRQQQRRPQSPRALAAEIKAVRAHVFEQHTGHNGQRSGRKAILRAMKGRHIADWYFTLTGPKLPMTSDDIEEE